MKEEQQSKKPAFDSKRDALIFWGTGLVLVGGTGFVVYVCIRIAIKVIAWALS